MTSMLDTTMVFLVDGTARLSGIDMGGPLLIQARNEHYIAVKVAGHMRWSRVGEQCYELTRVTIYRVKKWLKPPERGPYTATCQVEEVLEWKTGRKKS